MIYSKGSKPKPKPAGFGWLLRLLLLVHIVVVEETHPPFFSLVLALVVG